MLFVSSDEVSCVVFDPQNPNILASSSWDETVKIWDITSGSCLSTLRGHSDRVTSVAFNKEGTLLASSSYDKTVKIWDPVSGEEKCTLMGDLPIWSVAFSAGGHCIAAGCGDESEGEILIFKLQESGDWEMQSERRA